MVVPQAIAYAQIAGLPPQAGVFAAFAAPLGYALFGTSRQLIVSPTSATAALSAVLVAPLVVSGDVGEYAALSAMLAILCGLVYLLLGRFKLGFLSQFVAPSVQRGFLVGMGLTIMVGQLCKVLGIAEGDGVFYRQAWHVVQHLGETNGLAVLMGGSALITAFLLRRITPALPSALIVLALSIVIVSLFKLDQHGMEVVGSIDRALPLPKIPVVSIHDALVLIPGTLAIVVVGYSESMSVARGLADRHRYQIHPNQELTALGMSSIFGGLFQGFITAGGASKSASNDRAGAKTQVAAVVLAVLAFLSAILLVPLFRNLPQAVLGAIVISGMMGFMDVPGMLRLRRLRADSFWLAVVAMLAVLVLGILPGLLIAIGISILLLLSQLSRPSGDVMGRLEPGGIFVGINSTPGVEAEPGLLIYRPTAPLLFVNTDWELERLREVVSTQTDPPLVVVLDLGASAQLDLAGLNFLEVIQRDLSHDGRELWLSTVSPAVADIISRSDLAAHLTAERCYRHNDSAWRAFRERAATGSAERASPP